MQELGRGDALIFNGVIDGEEEARIILVDCGIDRLLQNAVARFENGALGLVFLDGLGEQHERHQGVALIVGTFIIIAVG